MGLPTFSAALCLLGILASSFFLRASADCCSRGWAQSQDYCYKFFEKKASWAEAETQCQRHGHGTHLASIRTKGETDFMSNYLKPKMEKGNVWIGLRDFCENRSWKWSDGSADKYAAWMKNEPNNIGNSEDCAELTPETSYKEWNDRPCETQNAYICKYKLEASGSPKLRLL